MTAVLKMVTLKRKAYTLIEVMMAIGIMTVGSVGIMSLQQAATGANVQARNQTMANEATRIWLERLRRDGLKWGWDPNNNRNLLETDYLTSAQAVAIGDMSEWEAMIPAASTESWGFDYELRDTRSTANITFCTNVRLGWTAGGAALRTDVRTWWQRYSVSTHDQYATDTVPLCESGNQTALNTQLAGAGILRSVAASQLLRPVEFQP